MTIDDRTPDRNLALDLVRVTEAAALAASAWIGRGQKESADGAAVNAMRSILATVPMTGTVIIGEGEKDHAPMLYNGEVIGDGTGPVADVAVDPIEGTTPTAMGRWGAMSVIAVATRGSMFFPGPIVYMDKLASGPEGIGVVALDATPRDNIRELARAKGVAPKDITVAILDRPRHADLIEEVRSAGARVRLIGDGDVSAAVLTAIDESDVDLLMGVGGSPEAVLAAAAMRCLGGQLQARLWPRDTDERDRALAQGYDLEHVFATEELVDSDNVFFAGTGITDAELLRGVRIVGGRVHTHSIVMRSRSGTIRTVRAQHQLTKLRAIQLLS
ncbi:fructose-1,6-bisphosphatase, class II [Acidimicrobium ferrooxidans DSM 10331]|uniref:Fructose-1,6-bisphosphatase n=1 Tax=Acidimicrobium ferrooxidans (strain DSM 10331 / JCM 15462 / NBRC 103882 / ICP) TaxID=525909 RepID=C7M158_ACIFD|nr:class II fructose-bisphosphatase [Acidimicrobium ferrooxidans]ACU54706.1 fructose-1,6-bisphosphatase, class II [Acidimicrobium ferrooxidans DSM 10331]